MSWNYRVIVHRSGDKRIDDGYFIHEVYYGERGKIDGWSENGMQPMGSSLKELRGDMRLFALALLQPVLDVKNGKLKAVKP